MKDNKDIDKKLEAMEEKLDAITYNLSHPPYRILNESNEDARFASLNSSSALDLIRLWSILWHGKWWIIGVTFIFSVVGVLYALSLPNIYKSEGVYALAQKQGAGSIGGHLGGLASLAGVNLGGGESNDVDQAIILIKSWPFLESVINQHKLKPVIMDVKGWNKLTGELIWDDKLVNSEKDKLKGAGHDHRGGYSSFDVYSTFSEFIEVKSDAKTGMIQIAVSHYSPVIAEEWVRILVEAINTHFQKRDIVDARRNIDYLEDKISETGVAEMKSVLFEMVESQLKTLMLAEVGNEYLLKEVVPPMVAERKFKPAKTMICIFFVLFGGGLSGFIVLVLGLIKSQNLVRS